MMKKILFMLAFVVAIGYGCTLAQAPVQIAKQFCFAVYDNNMEYAKTLMVEDFARRTPNRMSFSDAEGREYSQKLLNSKYKIVQGVTTSLVTVRFYDPNYEYLDKRGRWFCCSVGLVQTPNGWKVTNYGY